MKHNEGLNQGISIERKVKGLRLQKKKNQEGESIGTNWIKERKN